MSLLAHAVLLALALWAGSAAGGGPLFTDLGAGTGDAADEAGGGGGGSSGEEQVTYFEVPAPPPPPAPAVEPDPSELLFPEMPPVAADTVPFLPAETPVAGPSDAAPSRVLGDVAGAGAPPGTGSGGGIGSGTGTGVGPGSGSGTGGGAGSGTGSGVGAGEGTGRIAPPVPEVVLLPPQPPRGLRGRSLTVRLTIDAEGMVRGVELDSGDRGYDRSLRRVAMDWRFRPARDPANRPVAGEYDAVFTF